MTEGARRLTIVQWGGDFREASQRLAAGGPETYRGQRYTVDFVETLARQLESVTTITGFTAEPYDERLPSGVRTIGGGFARTFDGAHIADLVEGTAPDALILRTPSRPVMRWARHHQCRTLLLLADSFDESSIKGVVRRRLLRRHLRHPVFEIIANHGVQAAQSLFSIGADPDRVIAWDYPAFDTPDARPAKAAAGAPFHILFVGALTADKGIDELVMAAALLKDQGLDIYLDLVGQGEDKRVSKLLVDSGLAGSARLAGLVPNAEIVPRMAQADAVVVPSRHAYSEGMPLTIYEAYCSRTPLVVSDHPMFRGNVIDGESGLVFSAGDANELASCFARLAREPSLYKKLSEGGKAAWQRLQLSVSWGELIEHWLENSAESREWLARQRVAVPRD